MKRWLDRALSHWYVTRAEYEDRRWPLMSLDSNGVLLTFGIEPPQTRTEAQVLVASDFKRGIPCS